MKSTSSLFLRVLLPVLALGLSKTSSGQTWVGNTNPAQGAIGSGNWESGDKWSPNTATGGPGAGSSPVLNGGELHLNNTHTVASFTLTSGLLIGELTTTGTFNFSGGTLVTGSSNGVKALGGLASPAGATLTFGGYGPYGGQLDVYASTTSSSHFLGIGTGSGSMRAYNSTFTLVDGGSVGATESQFYFGIRDGSALVINSGAQITNTLIGFELSATGTGTLTNAGYLQPTSISGDTGATITNTGTIRLTQGDISVGSSGTITNHGLISTAFAPNSSTLIGRGTLDNYGEIHVDDGTQASITNPINFKAGATLTGGGTLFFDHNGAITYNFDDDIVIQPNIRANSGPAVLNSDHAMTIDGQLQGGIAHGFAATFSGSGNLDLNGGGYLGGTTFDGKNATLTAGHTFDFESNVSLLNGATLKNYGTINVLGAALTNNQGLPSTFENHGTMIFDSSSLNVDSTVNFINYGTLSLTSAGIGGSGSLRLKAGGLLTGDTNGNVISVSVSNGGEIAPGLQIGKIRIDNTVTLESTSKLTFQLGGLSQGSGYDTITVNGAISLAGTLGIDFYGGFENNVTSGNSFQILTTGSLTGTFNGIANGSRIATEDGLGSFVVNYSTNGVTLSNYSAVPEPSEWAMLVMGLCMGCIGLNIRRKRSVQGGRS